MKFIFADSLDLVDPRYDFKADRNGIGRKPYWDDVYPHELLATAPYDGMLVSRGIVESKYTESQAMRFRRSGARVFLRLDEPERARFDIFGDCGAFTYANEDVPPYTPDDMAEFYDDCGFTHGCSVDHIIFDYDLTLKGMEGGSAKAHERFEVTLTNAQKFLEATRHMSNRFTPMGVVQGWSPGSMAEAARRLATMGYNYLAIGGMAPLKADQIRSCLQAIREAIPLDTRIHILGFAKANDIKLFAPFKITSFDTSSPLIRAFKDAKQNYYLPNGDKGLSYYTALRIPQALENTKLLKHIKSGTFRSEDLSRLEAAALDSVRAYDKGQVTLDETLEAVLAYNAPFAVGQHFEEVRDSTTMRTLAKQYRVTLEEQPWRRCDCSICRSLSIEVMIFRAANRNRRRGIHNLGVYKSLIDNLPPSGEAS
ncbi:hypothetical protein JL101_029375 (plasmid) [Skermanella rosea]|uniref:tRNA-guanine transglycosylase DpdA n=1 Tax=Skermanella rosea TaxID=1817965 RepID=UPI0019347DD4|nr:tRNA-guanine transglycosylase DpdA [Skermanella rosea]UEM07113.1 hypothetical protein JL101_029375 [Skermanella rosea]